MTLTLAEFKVQSWDLFFTQSMFHPFSIYVSHLFDLTDLSNFTDDNFILSFHKNKENGVALMV